MDRPRFAFLAGLFDFRLSATALILFVEREFGRLGTRVILKKAFPTRPESGKATGTEAPRSGETQVSARGVESNLASLD